MGYQDETFYAFRHVGNELVALHQATSDAAQYAGYLISHNDGIGALFVPGTPGDTVHPDDLDRFMHQCGVQEARPIGTIASCIGWGPDGYDI